MSRRPPRLGPLASTRRGTSSGITQLGMDAPMAFCGSGANATTMGTPKTRPNARKTEHAIRPKDDARLDALSAGKETLMLKQLVIRGRLVLLVLTPALLFAQQALAGNANPYVDAAAKENGDGSREHPFWRITDGVVAARALRQHYHHHGITLHVLPGTYVGSYEADHLAGNPRLELLPIILNVSDLSLEGATELDEDANGLPTGTYPLESETFLTTDLHLSPGQTLLLIATTTDGMAGNGVSVSGFVMDAQESSSS